MSTIEHPMIRMRVSVLNSFINQLIEAQPLSQALLQTIRMIGEYKGKQDMFKSQAPQILDTLQNAAIIASTDSSNRIEGIHAPIGRIYSLIAEKTEPQNRSEAEIAGYRDVLQTIHANFENMNFTPSLILQLHGYLYQYVPDDGGRWKMTDNQITEARPDGTKAGRFNPLPAFRTADAMDMLHKHFCQAWNSNTIEKLLLIPTYILDFLCIHPFRDGNGRMARLITLLLLYQAGYEAGRYISLEAQIEKTREGYYDSLYKSSIGWHEGEHSLIPWWEYFLQVILLPSYREFEKRVSIVTTAKGAKSDMVRDVVKRLPKEFKFTDIQRACPGISAATIRRCLDELRCQGTVEPTSRGPSATWRKP